MVIAGKVDAVKAAVEAGYVRAKALGAVYGCEVIPNPHEEVLKFFDMDN